MIPGQRKSRKRELILEKLKATTSHPTADELYEEVRKVFPNISLGTVYRNLDLLASSGVIQRFEAGGKKRYDANKTNHPHVRCVSCGKMDDIHMDVEVPIPAGEYARGYRILAGCVEYLGICPECLEKGFRET